MQLVDDLYYYTDGAIWYLLAALRVWALVDCLTRRSSAFPAVDKLTKPAWVGILLVSGLLGLVFSLPIGSSNVVQIIPLASVVASVVYLADVRPAVREISGGR